MIERGRFYRFAVVALIVAMPLFAFAGASGRGSSITFDVPGGYDTATLTIMGPDGEPYTATYRGGQPVTFNLKDLPGNAVSDGSYSYQIRFAVHVPAGIAKQLEAARAAGDTNASKKILAAAGISVPDPVSGYFAVNLGSIVDTAAVEGGSAARLGTTENGTTSGSTTRSGSITDRFDPVTQDQVIPDDLIVQGSACVGLDCVNNENFGFDTIRLKENNLRIHYDDTSTSAGFPNVDWRLSANDSNSGGANKFTIEDATNAKVPFTVEGNAPTNTLYVDDSGQIGVNTNAPVLDVHMSSSDTPGIRLEQTNAGGFTAQTWDVAGNEANFFVRDVTGGSLLSLRIRPGAPTSSLDIASSGDIGIGNASPIAKVDIRGTNEHVLIGPSDMTTDFLGTIQTGYGASNGTERLLFAVQTGLGALGTVSNTTLGLIANNSTRMAITGTGNVGINTLTPGSQLVISTTGGGTQSSINAGATQFTVTSSRTFKENIAPVETPDILEKIQAIPVVTYDFKDNGPTDRIGLIAEDFHTVFNRGDDKHIDGHEVQMALWLAVQQLTQENKALTEELKAQKQQLLDRIAALEGQITKQ